MRNYIYNTAKAVAPTLLLLLFLLPSCSKESGNEPEIPETKYAKLTITLGSTDNAMPSGTRAGVENGYGKNDIINPDSADSNYERHIDDLWVVVLKKDGKTVERVLSNKQQDEITQVNPADEDNRHQAEIELLVGETYKFYAFANLGSLATEDAKSYIADLKPGNEFSLTTAVSLKAMSDYNAQQNTTPIPMSSYGYEETVVENPTGSQNQVEIPLIRLIGKVDVDVTNATGKPITVSSITMGKFRTTGNIYLLPYDAARGMGTENLLIGKSTDTNENKLLNPLFPTDQELVGEDITPELPDNKKTLDADGDDSKRTYSFYVNETAQENQVGGTSDMTIALDVEGVEKDPAPRNTNFFFVRRNDWLKIPILISDANTQVTIKQQHMPIGGLPIQLTFPDGAIISDQTINLDHGGKVEIGYSLQEVNSTTDWSLKYYTGNYQTGDQFCYAQVVENDKQPNGEGLILQADTTKMGTDEDTGMWTNLKWLGGTDKKPIYGYKLTPDKVAGTETDSQTSGSFTIRVQELVSGTAKIKLTLVATKGDSEVILPYTLTIKFGKGGN